MPQAPTITVVIPIHNEADYLPGAFAELEAQLAEVPASVDVVLAENGSADDTRRVARRLAATRDHVRVIELPEPDYGGALRAGFLAADGDWVVNLDIDYFSGDFLRRFLEVAEEADIVLASKRAPGSDDRRSTLRRLATRVFNLVLKALVGSGVSDTHGIKAIRADVVAEIVPRVVSRQDLFDTELVIRAHRAGHRIVELPIVVEERREARSSLLRRVPRTLRGVWRIRKALRSER